MNREVVLATTALEETWGSGDRHLVFLGEWCRLYTRKHIWEKQSHEVLAYHWRDRGKLNKDHAYLKVCYEQFIKIVSAFLNDYHNTDYPNSYWRIIVGPWLLTMIPILWDRWESLKQANFEKIDTIYVLEEVHHSSHDYKEFIRNLNSHYLNHKSIH